MCEGCWAQDNAIDIVISLCDCVHATMLDEMLHATNIAHIALIVDDGECNLQPQLSIFTTTWHQLTSSLQSQIYRQSFAEVSLKNVLIVSNRHQRELNVFVGK